MQRKRLALIVVGGLSLCGPCLAKSLFTLDWQGVTIRFGDSANREPTRLSIEHPTTQKPAVDCAFVSGEAREPMKTKCLRVRKAPPNSVYGVGLRFLKPIPVLPP